MKAPWRRPLFTLWEMIVCISEGNHPNMNEIAERNVALFDGTELLVFVKARPKNTKLDGHEFLGLENGSHLEIMGNSSAMLLAESDR